MFLYHFSTPRQRRTTGAWWVRTEVGAIVTPVSLRGRRSA
jgi:hypothetical protein